MSGAPSSSSAALNALRVAASNSAACVGPAQSPWPGSSRARSPPIVARQRLGVAAEGPVRPPLPGTTGWLTFEPARSGARDSVDARSVRWPAAGSPGRKRRVGGRRRASRRGPTASKVPARPRLRAGVGAARAGRTPGARLGGARGRVPEPGESRPERHRGPRPQLYSAAPGSKVPSPSRKRCVRAPPAASPAPGRALDRESRRLLNPRVRARGGVNCARDRTIRPAAETQRHPLAQDFRAPRDLGRMPKLDSSSAHCAGLLGSTGPAGTGLILQLQDEGSARCPGPVNRWGARPCASQRQARSVHSRSTRPDAEPSRPEREGPITPQLRCRRHRPGGPQHVAWDRAPGRRGVRQHHAGRLEQRLSPGARHRLQHDLEHVRCHGGRDTGWRAESGALPPGARQTAAATQA
jgi:hypothetical protein